MGIIVNFDLDYVVIEFVGEKYVVVEVFLLSLCEKLGFEDVIVVKIVCGFEFDCVVIKYLFYDCDFLVMNGEYVIVEVGIGVVYMVFGYGEDDFLIGKKYDLEVFVLLDDCGVFIEEVLGFEGVFYDIVNKMVIEKLEEVGVLLKMEFIIYFYLYDWCMKKLVIFCVIV